MSIVAYVFTKVLNKTFNLYKFYFKKDFSGFVFWNYHP